MFAANVFRKRRFELPDTRAGGEPSAAQHFHDRVDFVLFNQRAAERQKICGNNRHETRLLRNWTAASSYASEALARTSSRTAIGRNCATQSRIMADHCKYVSTDRKS